jgi:MYXO-CTERM domain-containing protein
MKLRNLIASFALITAGTSFGAAGIYDALVFTTTTGGTPLTFYDIGAVTVNPDFDGGDLGDFNLGSVFQIGGQQKSYKNTGSDVTSHTIYWKVTGAFTGVNMPFQWNQGDGGAPSGLNNAGDQQWGGDVQGGNASLVLSGNVLSGLTAGDYTLEVYSEITTNGVDAAGTIGNVNGGNNYKATFTVVPEPTSAALGLLGVGLLLRRRRI